MHSYSAAALMEFSQAKYPGCFLRVYFTFWFVLKVVWCKEVLRVNAWFLKRFCPSVTLPCCLASSVAAALPGNWLQGAEMSMWSPWGLPAQPGPVPILNPLPAVGAGCQLYGASYVYRAWVFFVCLFIYFNVLQNIHSQVKEKKIKIRLFFPTTHCVRRAVFLPRGSMLTQCHWETFTSQKVLWYFEVTFLNSNLIEWHLLLAPQWCGDMHTRCVERGAPCAHTASIQALCPPE